MKTNIEVDDVLIKEAMKLDASKTMKEVIHDALDSYVQYLKRQSVITLFGKAKWDGDLDDMRNAKQLK